MSQTAITYAFEQWKAQQAAEGVDVVLDEFVFANVPGLDPSSSIDRAEMVPLDHIVWRQAVTGVGRVNENAVTYSIVLDSNTGDFSFNWIGLINRDSGTLAMVVHAPTQQKTATKEGQQGNTLTRSFLMEYNGAAKETAINTPAETWQIDFTARLAGMDERLRLENIDIYGDAAFFDDGWLVVNTGASYVVKSGAGYVRGLRAQLVAEQEVTVGSLPSNVWLDVCWAGALTSVWEAESKIVVAESLSDYEQNGTRHYVFALASIDASGLVTDLRPKGSLGDQQANKDFLRKDNNLDDLKDEAIARVNLGLKSAAIHDVQENRDDITPGRVLVNGGALALRSVSASGEGGAYAADCNDLPVNSVSFCYGSAAHSPGYEATILDVAGLRSDYRVQYAASYSDGGKRLKFRTRNGDNGQWGAWANVLTNYGGDVDHLNNANYYHINPAAWPGAGAFADQYKNPVAPFIIPYGRATPKDNSQYLPIIKALSSTEGHDYGAAVSFGILRTGNADFGSAVIHILGDNGTGAVYQFGYDGTFYSPGQISSGGNIVAGSGLFESGGAVRVYSPNNPPDLSAYATTSWTVANFLQGGLRLASAGVATNGNNDNEFAYAPNGTVVTAVQQKTNYTAVQYRYLQYNIGGNWYTAWVA